MRTKYLAKIGMMPLNLNREQSRALNKLFDLDEGENAKYYDVVNQLHKKIEETISSSSDVTKTHWLGELQKEHSEPFMHHNNEDVDFLQSATSCLCFEAFIPKAERCYSFDVRYEDKVIEKFTVLYDGVYFLAYAEIDDDTCTTMFGQEVREFMKTILENDLWTPISIPPCPMHPEIIIEKDNKCHQEKIEKGEDIEIKIYLPQMTKDEMNDFLEYYLHMNSFLMEAFFSLATLQEKVEKYTNEIEKTFSALTDVYSQYASLDWYKFLSKIKIMKIMQKNIFELQVQITQYSSLLFQLNKESKCFVDKDNIDMLGTGLTTYFDHYLAKEKIPLNDIKETLGYVARTISNSYLNYYTLAAAIIGGVVGALLARIGR